MTVVPNLTGRTLEEARMALTAAGLNIRISGLGSATAQEPAAGASVEKGEVVGVAFQQAAVD
jgi:beta-lactam-binding protein with PASTA domain